MIDALQATALTLLSPFVQGGQHVAALAGAHPIKIFLAAVLASVFALTRTNRTI